MGGGREGHRGSTGFLKKLTCTEDVKQEDHLTGVNFILGKGRMRRSNQSLEGRVGKPDKSE